MQQKENRFGEDVDRDEIDIAELFGVVWKRRLLVISIVFFTSLMTAIISLVMTPFYSGKATIIPIVSKNSLTNLNIPTDFFALMGIGGASVQSSENIMLSVLESRTLAERVIKKLNLYPFLYPKKWDKATGSWRKEIPPEKIPTDAEIAESFLENNIKISSDKRKGTIEIKSLFPKNPTLAAAIPNLYIELLDRELVEKAFTISKKNRMFIEDMLKAKAVELEKAEEDFKKFQEKYNILSVDKQTEESIKLYAVLAAELSKKTIELEVLRKFSSEDNPEIIRLKSEVREIENKLREIEGEPVRGGYVLSKNTKMLLPLEKVPDLAIKYIRVRRDFETENLIYTTLMKLYEQAKIEEAKEEISFQVIDPAYTPKYRAKPKRRLMVVSAFAASLFFSVFLCFILEAVEKRKKEQKSKD